MYRAAPIHNELYRDISIRIEHGEARVELPISEKYFHSGMSLHGSVYFKLLDDAAYFAAQSLVEDVFLFTADFNIRFISPVKSGILTAVGTCLNSDDRLVKASGKLFDEAGNICAKGNGRFAKSDLKLEEVTGYS